jgi:hypothetical protein
MRRRGTVDSARRERVLDAAVAAGKFLPSRRSHYAAMYDADPAGTEQVLAIMAGAPEALAAVETGAEGYNEDLLTPGERVRLASRRTANVAGSRPAARASDADDLAASEYPADLLSESERETIAAGAHGRRADAIAGDAAGGRVPGQER